LNNFLSLLERKLKQGGHLVATVSNLDGKLKSFSTNARFFYNGKSFPDDKVIQLRDGDSFTIRFFKTTGNPDSGFLMGAETTKFYHTPEHILSLANKYHFESFLGDWKKYIPAKEGIDQDILVLSKK
jgi:hypothetical protein